MKSQPMDQHRMSAGVIGGGISGLSTAYFLMEQGVSVTLYERDSHAGGVIRTHRSGDWQVEEGPGTLMVRDPQVWDMLEALGLSGSVMEAEPAANNRFIVKGGRLEKLPLSPFELIRSPLLSAGAKAGLLMEPFRPSSDDPEETIASFVERRLGKEVLDWLVNPFVAGIFAGDPERLSMRHTLPELWELERDHGSLLRGMLRGRKGGKRRKLISFRRGLAELPEALVRYLDNRIICNAPVRRVEAAAGGRWKLSVGGRGDAPEHDAVVVACPPRDAAGLLHPSAAKEALGDIPFAPLAVLATGFSQESVGHPLNGFGMLVPERESAPMLGTLFSSRLFPGRAPERHRLLTHFIGGTRQPHLAGEDPDSLLEQLLPQLNRLLGISGQPAFLHHRHWPQAIPQYESGHSRLAEAIERLEEENRGLFLEGNYRGGVSLQDCILSGRKTAGRVASFMGKPA